MSTLTQKSLGQVAYEASPIYEKLDWEELDSVSQQLFEVVSSAVETEVRKQVALEQNLFTPAANWRKDGNPDPFDDHYSADKERASLILGNLTDDEVANAIFMNYDANPSMQDVIAGKAFRPIIYATAVKERIRWLSRSLVAATEELNKIKEEDKNAKVEAYLVPCIMSFKDVTKTSCPVELQPEIEGRVMWDASVFCDLDFVVDKNGVEYKPLALVIKKGQYATEPPVTLSPTLIEHFKQSIEETNLSEKVNRLAQSLD